MHPSVDKTSTPSPSTTMSTSGNNSEPSTAHPLIKEITMRITAAFLSLPLIACVGNVGDGPSRGRGSQDGSGSATATCDDPEVIREDLVIDSASDFDSLPKG